MKSIKIGRDIKSLPPTFVSFLTAIAKDFSDISTFCKMLSYVATRGVTRIVSFLYWISSAVLLVANWSYTKIL